MYEPNQQLINSADFDNVMYFGRSVMVMQDDEVLEVGRITSNSTYTVGIGDGYYLKDNCIFLIC